MARCKIEGFDISACKNAYLVNFHYLYSNNIPQQEARQPGIYNGSTSISLAIIEAIRANLIEMPVEHYTEIFNGFYVETPDLSIAGGISGQGLGLLNCREILGSSKVDPLLHQYLQQIISGQERDGSWIQYKNTAGRIPTKIFGFSYGIAGIVHFLLQSYEVYRLEALLSSALLGLSFLEKQAIPSGSQLVWKTHPTGEPNPWLEYGVAGITMAFVKAYSITQDLHYKGIAEAGLRTHPPYIVTPYLSIASGVSGLGMIYKKAEDHFRTGEWQERADWVTRLLLKTVHSKDRDTAHWIVNNNLFPTADLLTGNAGIVLYLMEYLRLKQ
jgi:hypothetical protein